MPHTLLPETVDLLGDLVAFPTVSADPNLDLIHFVGERLDRLGARVRITHDAGRRKANIFATFGPDADGGIVLSGHTDVVPVEGQDWQSDPFALTELDGRLYGRGTCDMKGFIAAALTLAPSFAALELKRPLHFAFTYDEEVGCLGAQIMLADLAAAHGFDRAEALRLINDPEELAITERAAHEAAGQGISGVPFFVFGEKYALSGAQPQDVFGMALEKTLSEI